MGCSLCLSYYTTGDWRKLLRMSEVFSKTAVGLEREVVQVTDPCHHSIAEPLLELRDGTQAGPRTNKRRYIRVVEQA